MHCCPNVHAREVRQYNCRPDHKPYRIVLADLARTLDAMFRENVPQVNYTRSQPVSKGANRWACILDAVDGQ